MVRWCWVNFQCRGRPTNLDYSSARACCACSRCGRRLFGHFSLIIHFSFLSPSLWDTARHRLKYCLKGPLKPKNQPTNFCFTRGCSSGVMVLRELQGPENKGLLLLQEMRVVVFGRFCLSSVIPLSIFLPLSWRRPDID